MSRLNRVLDQPVEFFSGTVVSVSYGLDHACGYFICAKDANGEIVDEFDSLGFGFVGKEALNKHSNSFMAEAFIKLGMKDVAQSVFMDLPI